MSADNLFENASCAEVKPPKIQGIPDRPKKVPQTVAKPANNWMLKITLLGIVVLVVLVCGGFALIHKHKKG